MYCYHCGKKIDEHKIEAKQATLNPEMEVDSDVQVQYICPRCGHLIRHGLNEEDRKELSRASHAQIQRASNSFARGMSFNAIGLIILIISYIFFKLANKPAAGKLVTNCAEFYVFIVSLILSVILLGFGAWLTVIGVVNKRHYSQLLKDLNNKTFAQ